jgi:nitroreductase
MTMENRPNSFPTSLPEGGPLKSLTQVLLDRRATTEFSSDEVPLEFLNAILRFAAQAPSGYNLQPWRFIVVRDPDNRKRLQQAAFGQPKVGGAPVVIIAIGMKEQWKERAEEVFIEAAQRGAGSIDNVTKYKQSALDFLSKLPMPLWVNRHTMIAFTTMMLVAEAYGFDTAPLEGFDAEAVKREFQIPEEGEVVALLAIGRASTPDKPYTGRFALDRIVHDEQFGKPWTHG